MRCVNNHDLEIVGTYPTGGCRACGRMSARRYRTTHRKQERARHNRWRSKRPRFIPKQTPKAERNRRYQAATSICDSDTLEYIQVLRGDPCSYCDEPSTETDHITSVNQSGAHHWTNMTSACRRCNAMKQDKSLLMWLCQKT